MKGNRSDRLADLLSLLLIVGLAVAVGALLIYLTSSDPRAALRAFFLGPFSNGFFFGNMLQSAAPLLIIGLGLVISFRAGAVNLGGEGQVYMGGLAGAAVLLLAPADAPLWLLPLAVLAAALTGAVFAALAGWLRTRFGATEVITSFLIGAILLELFDFLLRRYLVDPLAGFPASESLPAAYRLARLMPPSSLNVGFLIGIVLAVLVYVLLFRSAFGYELRMTGSNPRFARFSGMRVSGLFVVAMALSGAFAGLAAIFEVTGVHGRLVVGFSDNLGWNGIMVALVARLHPLGVIPAALLHAYLHTGANTAGLLADVSPRIAAIIEAIIFYLITAQAIFIWIRAALDRRGRPVLPEGMGIPAGRGSAE